MKNLYYYFFTILFLGILSTAVNAQTIKGKVLDGDTGEELIGANVVLKDNTSKGTITDFDGSFELKVDALPTTLLVSYLGFEDKEIPVASADAPLKIELGDSPNVLDLNVVVKGQRVSEEQKKAPLTIESMDLLAIKETPADNFYDGLGSMKGVDLTAASLGFKVINTRGFNSTSPVRSLQTIDGVDNQAPGLNFSLGNFLGTSELDVLKVDLIQGAASAYYGPNAFNGVISMETKNPFYQKGLSAMVKGGERNLLETAVRWADAVKNKDGNDFFAYKLNLSYLRADDWEAENYGPIDGSRVEEGNPGGWDAVNIYGDEYFSLNDLSSDVNLSGIGAGLGTFYRTGYKEEELVNYDTRNLKANVALHFKTNPAAEYDSPEFIVSSSLGNGTTVYQGDNRFSLKNILFFQNRLEFRKKDKFFLRAYATHEDAGDSYDPYFTALRLKELAKDDETWSLNYIDWWGDNDIKGQMEEMGYELELLIDPITGLPYLDTSSAKEWVANNSEWLAARHAEAAAYANTQDIQNLDTTQDFFAPGTDRFNTAFNDIISRKNNEGGTRFHDKSALYHLHGEYNFETTAIDNIKVGANFRQYRPVSEGTVFNDTIGTPAIINSEFGVYTGFEKKFSRQWIATATFRVDKNSNFDYLFTPAASLVYSPDPLNYLRFSFSSGVRNPTLTDQYLSLNVGPATLIGNLNGVYDLVSLESFIDRLEDPTNSLDTMSIAPIAPERVKTFEVGYRTTLFDQIYIDASYYYSIYNDFIGYNLGVDAEFDSGFLTKADVYRVSANSINEVTTQGFSIALNYYFSKYYKFSGNYSWNRLNTDIDDPIVPAFNTPEHKFNLGISGRNIPIKLGGKTVDTGVSLNYKWIQGFLFEGSPQFTGFIENYGLLDAQVNFNLKKIDTILKIGASNLLNNAVSQTFGGPKIGRLGYISLVYEFKKK